MHHKKKEHKHKDVISFLLCKKKAEKEKNNPIGFIPKDLIDKIDHFVKN